MLSGLCGIVFYVSLGFVMVHTCGDKMNIRVMSIVVLFVDINGPLSPIMQSPPVTSISGNKGSDPHILKWFSPEVLKNQLPTMPPLPVQGQKVLTLDELEGARQALTN